VEKYIERDMKGLIPAQKTVKTVKTMKTIILMVQPDTNV